MIARVFETCWYLIACDTMYIIHVHLLVLLCKFIPPTCFGHSCGHLQGGEAKDKKLKDDTITEMTKPTQDIYHFISWIGFITSMIVSSFNLLSFILPPWRWPLWPRLLWGYCKQKLFHLFAFCWYYYCTTYMHKQLAFFAFETGLGTIHHEHFFYTIFKYRTIIILQVLLYGCNMWSLNLK